jgi:hypothetical protein
LNCLTVNSVLFMYGAFLPFSGVQRTRGSYRVWIRELWIQTWTTKRHSWLLSSCE